MSSFYFGISQISVRVVICLCKGFAQNRHVVVVWWLSIILSIIVLGWTIIRYQIRLSRPAYTVSCARQLEPFNEVDKEGKHTNVHQPPRGIIITFADIIPCLDLAGILFLRQERFSCLVCCFVLFFGSLLNGRTQESANQIRQGFVSNVKQIPGT